MDRKRKRKDSNFFLRQEIPDEYNTMQIERSAMRELTKKKKKEYYLHLKKENDEFVTPPYVWVSIKRFIPKDITIWEPFYYDGKSGDTLKTLGFSVIHEDIDFFKHDKGDVVISNPPFSQWKEILARLKNLKKPFILLLPSAKLSSKFFRNLFPSLQDIQLIIPRQRIQFHAYKNTNGKIVKYVPNKCSFDCFFYCYRMKFEKDLNFSDFCE